MFLLTPSSETEMKGSTPRAVCEGRKGEAESESEALPPGSLGVSMEPSSQPGLEISLSALFTGQRWSMAPLCKWKPSVKCSLTNT